MATQSSYTTVKVTRFGFPVLSVTLDRVNTQEVKQVACSLIASATGANEDDQEFIESRWDDSLKANDKYIALNIEAGGDYRDDFSVSIHHFDITEQQRINAVRAEADVSPMFL